jgi:tetratricopeptide (TPR) repeat protein
MGFRRQAARGTGFKRIQFLKIAFFGLLMLVFIALLPSAYNRLFGDSINERRLLREYFESGAFEAAHTQSALLLMERPLDPYLLTIHGFSAYQLAIAQINSVDTLSYMDDSIWSLRKALLSRENSQDGRIFYVLGKAYYYKGQGFADLAVEYLEKASAANFVASDISEYLGLAYAALGDYRSSVAAFSHTLTSEREPSDLLLLSIARSYLAMEELEAARAYLVRCLQVSRDSNTVVVARLLMGNTLALLGDLAGAEAEYLRVIEENGENAEASFQLGELYALGGETTRARAEWRRALRLDPTHGPARSRLN